MDDETISPLCETFDSLFLLPLGATRILTMKYNKYFLKGEARIFSMKSNIQTLPQGATRIFSMKSDIQTLPQGGRG